MPRQVHATITRSTTPTRQEMDELAATDAAKASEHVTVEDIDDLLDEIDSVLEENANEVLRTYIQRGGE